MGPLPDELGNDEPIPEGWLAQRGMEVSCVKFEYDALEEAQA